MPTYVYESVAAPHERFEVSQRMSEAALTTHPDSGVAIRRVISGGLGFLGASNQASGPGATPTGGCGTGGCGHAHH